jgi:hypothetical protein
VTIKTSYFVDFEAEINYYETSNIYNGICKISRSKELLILQTSKNFRHVGLVGVGWCGTGGKNKTTMLARTAKMGLRPRAMAPFSRMMSGKADAALDKNRIVNFKIYRFNPDESSEPHIQTYPVNMAECGEQSSVCFWGMLPRVVLLRPR